jgi:hypothetical protein
MFIKIIAIAAFVVILFSLGSALYSLIQNQGKEPSAKAVKALTVRIGLSVVLFIFIFIALASGLITPHGIGTRIHGQKPIASETNPKPANQRP